jgi:hypothetical protein
VNYHTCRMAFHDPREHPPRPPRVVPGGHEHNRLELMVVAPRRKNLTVTFGPNVGSGDLHDIRNAKPFQLANLPCGGILVREPSADELVVFSTRRVRKNRNSRRDAALHEVRGFERPRAAKHKEDTRPLAPGPCGTGPSLARPAKKRDASEFTTTRHRMISCCRARR